MKKYIKEFRELWAEVDKEVRWLFILRYISVILGVGGIVLLGVVVNWWASLAVFLMMTGNNIEQRLRRYR